jgi:uncharacterized protein with GYD domain
MCRNPATLPAAFVPTAGIANYLYLFNTRSLGREPSTYWFNLIGRTSVMHFCLEGQYTPHALNQILDNPNTNRLEAAKKLIEAAEGKLISMYSTPADGPGVLVIFDVPDPNAASAICGVVVASGAIQHPRLRRLMTQDEVLHVRQKASKLRQAYKPPGS